MSESILKALMRLFAIIANFDNSEEQGTGRDIVESYLQKQLSQDLVQEYLHLFDEYYAVHHKKKGRKKLS